MRFTLSYTVSSTERPKAGQRGHECPIPEESSPPGRGRLRAEVFVPTSFRSGIAGGVRSLSTETGGPPLRRQAEAKERTTMTGYVGRIESETLKNTYFRQVLFPGKTRHLEVT